MSKIVAVFFHENDPVSYLKHKPEYFQAYSQLTDEIRAISGEMVIVGGQETYRGDGVFSHHWMYVDDQILEGNDVRVDVVFNKSDFSGDDIPVFNPEFISHICTDKWATYQQFPHLSPQTFHLADQTNLTQSIGQISTELVVAKPIDGSEGKNVHILPKEEMSHAPLKYPLILQEFLDSSGGIPGIVDGLHDFRIAIVNGEIVYSYFRTPPQGSYLANVARGGTFRVVPVGDIPPSALKVVEEIDAVMARCPERFYGIDLAFTPQGIKIIELNSRLGLLPNSDGAEFVNLKKKLAKLLVEYQ